MSQVVWMYWASCSSAREPAGGGSRVMNLRGYKSALLSIGNSLTERNNIKLSLGICLC